MTYQPVIPMGGLAGWSFLARTRDAQQSAFNASPALDRDTAYFEERIGQVRTADALVADRRLLKVALGAFGLDADIDNRFFLRKVLEDGTLAPDALANRLADKRYRNFAKAFGFGDFDTPRTGLSDFGATITKAYRERQFEIAVGTRDSTMRLALGLDRALDEILATDTTEDGRWYAVMGQPPLRRVFETAFGLPAAFGALELETQMQTFRDRADALLGGREITQFRDPGRREDLRRLFLLRSEPDTGPAFTGPGATALTLLRPLARSGLLAG